MCNFLSGVVTISKHPQILCQDLLHHEKTVEALRLKPETYREWEWTRDDTGDSLDIYPSDSARRQLKAQKK